jgi:hypothetical protein
VSRSVKVPACVSPRPFFFGSRPQSHIPSSPRDARSPICLGKTAHSHPSESSAPNGSTGQIAEGPRLSSQSTRSRAPGVDFRMALVVWMNALPSVSDEVLSQPPSCRL